MDIILRSTIALRTASTHRRSIKRRSDDCGKMTKVSGMSEALLEVSKELKCCACGGHFLWTWLSHKEFDEDKTGAWEKPKSIQELEEARDEAGITDAAGATDEADGANAGAC